jgi:DNA repair exonuclease SbcCD ATPase subunit
MRSSDRLKKTIDELLVERELLRKQSSEIDDQVASLNEELEDLTTAKQVLSDAVRITQQQMSKYIESLVTLAIRSVFTDSDYKFVVDYKTRKDGRVEVSLLVKEGEQEPFHPEDEEGGGIVDIISFALRVVMWSIQAKRSRNVLILDEPFRFTGEYTELAGKMLKEVSQKLGIQVVMITHSRELMGIADRVWEVTKEQGRSVVRRVDRKEGRRENPNLRARLLARTGRKHKNEQTLTIKNKEKDSPIQKEAQ